MDGDVHLGRPAPVRARAQPVTDHLLEPADGRLDPRPLRVAGRFLPSRTSVLGDAFRLRSRCVGVVAAISLGKAVDRGGTMIAASGWRSATAAETPSWSQGPSAVNDATGPVT